MANPFLTEEHEAFRDQVKRFVNEELKPNLEAWEEAGEIPREVHRKAAQAGFYQLGYPEEYGGFTPPDGLYALVASEELAKSGSGGVVAALVTHHIGLPPVIAGGSDALKREIAQPVLDGEKLIALGITEPSGGSDVANLKTTAVLDPGSGSGAGGDEYVVNGSKTFITTGMRADYVTTAVRTGEAGMHGVSLLVIPTDSPGFSRTPLKKMGWWCSDTATLYFDNVRVPAGNRIGLENQGFLFIMRNFNSERLGMAAQCIGFSKLCHDYALDYARERQTFGRALVSRQVIRQKLARMQMRINALEMQAYGLAAAIDQGHNPVADIALLKVQASETFEHCANEAMQVLGGFGYMRENPVERMYRETKVQAIGGGSAEIMLDLAARQMRY